MFFEVQGKGDCFFSNLQSTAHLAFNKQVISGEHKKVMV